MSVTLDTRAIPRGESDDTRGKRAEIYRRPAAATVNISPAALDGKPVTDAIRQELLQEGGLRMLDQARGFAVVNLQDPRVFGSPLTERVLRNCLRIFPENLEKIEDIAFDPAAERAILLATPKHFQIETRAEREQMIAAMRRQAEALHQELQLTSQEPVIFFAGKMHITYFEADCARIEMEELCAPFPGKR